MSRNSKHQQEKGKSVKDMVNEFSNWKKLVITWVREKTAKQKLKIKGRKGKLRECENEVLKQ